MVPLILLVKPTARIVSETPSVPHDSLKGTQMVTHFKQLAIMIFISSGLYFGDMRPASTYQVSMVVITLTYFPAATCICHYHKTETE